MAKRRLLLNENQLDINLTEGYVTLDTTQTITGTKTFSENITGSKNIKATQQLIGGITNHGNTSGNISINLNAGNTQSFNLIGNVTITGFTSPGGGASYQLVFIQDGVGGKTVSWPASVKFAGGVDPVLSTAPNSIDVITLIYGVDGFNFLGVFSADFK